MMRFVQAALRRLLGDQGARAEEGRKMLLTDEQKRAVAERARNVVREWLLAERRTPGELDVDHLRSWVPALPYYPGHLLVTVWHAGDRDPVMVLYHPQQDSLELSPTAIWPSL